MSSIINRRRIRRILKKENPSKNLTLIELIEAPPNTFRWRGNDGNYYSPTYVKAQYAQNAAKGGSLKLM